MNPFSDPEAIANYIDGPPRMVPGYTSMQRMAGLLLAEHAPETARILIVGAGGGLEMKVFAEANPKWHFDGVDPAEPMLRLAERVMGPLIANTTLHHGLVDIAPEGPFDGATCLLTLHFLSMEERRHTIAEVYRRLKPGARFVVAHYSIPKGETKKWMARYAAFAIASGIDHDKATAASLAIAEKLNILSPEEDEALLRETGFKDVALFYAGFTFRGWVGVK